MILIFFIVFCYFITTWTLGMYIGVKLIDAVNSDSDLFDKTIVNASKHPVLFILTTGFQSNNLIKNIIHLLDFDAHLNTYKKK